MNIDISPEFYNILKPYEVLRKKIYKKRVMIIVAFFPMLFLIIYLGFQNCAFAWLFLPFGIAASKLGIETTEEEKRFIKNLKENCLPIFLKKYKNIEIKKYFESATLRRMLQKSGFLNCESMNEHSLFIDDNFEISLNNKTTKLFDYKITSHVADSYEDFETGTTIAKFKGVSLLLDLNKEIKNEIVITTKNNSPKNKRMLSYIFWIGILTIIFGFLLYGLIFSTIYNAKYETDAFYTTVGFLIFLFSTIVSLIYYAIKYNPRKKHINDKLEDIAFNKNYKIETLDQIEARYILTPTFIEALNNLKSLYKSNGLYCYVYLNKMFLLISTNKNSYEIGKLNTTLFSQKIIDNFYDEIETMLKAVETLSKY